MTNNIFMYDCEIDKSNIETLRTTSTIINDRMLLYTIKPNVTLILYKDIFFTLTEVFYFFSGNSSFFIEPYKKMMKYNKKISNHNCEHISSVFCEFINRYLDLASFVAEYNEILINSNYGTKCNITP